MTCPAAALDLSDWARVASVSCSAVTGSSPTRRWAGGRETVAIVRGLLTQKKFSYDGQWFKPNDFHLREGPIGQAAAPPIWLAGLGPKMVGTAAEGADGVIANCLPDESLAEYRGLIKQGAESAGRDPGDVQIATLLMTCVDPTDEAAVFAA